MSSDAGRKLRVGGGGHTSDAKRQKNFCHALDFFLVVQVELVSLVSAFVISTVQFGQFLVCCFYTHSAPPVPYGVGGRCTYH